MKRTTKALAIGTLGAALVGGPLLVSAVPQARTAVLAPTAAFAELVERLELSPVQQAQWDVLRAQAQRTRAMAESRLSDVRAALESELDGSAPDLRAVVGLLENSVDDITATSRAQRDDYLTFYEQMTPEQKAIISERLKERLSGLDRLRGILERFGARG